MKTMSPAFAEQLNKLSLTGRAALLTAFNVLIVFTLVAGSVTAQRARVRPGKHRGSGKLIGQSKTSLGALPPKTTSFGEDFTAISNLAANGWFFQNNSTQVGPGDWAQGDGSIFPAQLGESNTFISCTYESGTSPTTISNWMLTPSITMVNGDVVEFWTRDVDNSVYSDRLEVRLSTNGDSTNVGTLDSDVGDFTTVLLTINPAESTGVYPMSWTRYTATISGLSSATNGRLAFRYFNTNSGIGGANGDYIGIDSFRYYKTPSVQQSVYESFTDVSTLLANGWYIRNNSVPMGNQSWMQGRTDIFPSQSLATDGFIAVGYESGADASDLSDWLLSPPVTLKNGDQIKFWARTVDPQLFADRLEVRLSTSGTSTNVGSLASDVGDFTRLLMTINPSLTTTGFPNTWTEYSLIVTGLPTQFVGRVGFRYFVTNGGPTGANSDYIGVDNFSYFTVAPTAANVVLTGNVRSAEGHAISGAVVTLTDRDGQTRSTRTNNFGKFNFSDVPSGRTYVLGAAAKKMTFNTQIVDVADNISDLDFVANE